jgi:hypothetical protein
MVQDSFGGNKNGIDNNFGDDRALGHTNSLTNMQFGAINSRTNEGYDSSLQTATFNRSVPNGGNTIDVLLQIGEARDKEMLPKMHVQYDHNNNLLL